jgi:hypothetical protein
MHGEILDTIDGALTDWSVSRDAMRWNHEAGEVEARSTSSADFSLAMLPPLEPFGELSLRQPLPAPLAVIQPGMVISVDGELWRVTDRYEGVNGSATFDLEPA